MLTQTAFFIRERVGLLKLSDTYDILNPTNQDQIGIAKEIVSGGIHVLRFLIGKKLLPTSICVYSGQSAEAGILQFSIKRGFSLLRPKVDVLNAEGQSIGYFKSKLFSLGGAFTVHTTDGTEIAQVKGDWKGWNFKFTAGDTEIGTVSKKWSGFGKELFTSADNYMIQLHGTPDPTMCTLLLAAGLSIDMIYKEGK